MPEAGEGSNELVLPPPAEAAPGADDGTTGFDPWLLIALLAVAVAISIQNLWLRRRGEERNAERRASDEEGP